MDYQQANLTNPEMVRWRNLLEKRRKFIVDREQTLKRQDIEPLQLEATGEMTKVKTHPADLATDNQELDVLESLSEQNIKNLQEVEDAIDRLDKGEFGQCESCGEKIPEARLAVIPEARLCVECEQDQEDLEKKFRLDTYAAQKAQSNEVITAIAILGDLTVADIMQKDPIAVRMNEGIHQAMLLMREHNIRHLPVLDPAGDLQGILSDRDILNAFLKSRPWKLADQVDNPWKEVPVTSIMTKVPESAGPETSLAEAGTLMLENKISSLPIVDGARLIGLITEADFVKMVCQGV